MKKEFVPYKQALELKNLGFDESCLAWYNTKGVLLSDLTIGYESTDFTYRRSNMDSFNDTDPTCIAPLYQQAFRFFRENYGVKVISVGGDDSQKYNYLIHLKDNTQVFGEKKDIPEEAELACLDKLIEIVKNK
jgi:hypothetical protein